MEKGLHADITGRIIGAAIEVHRQLGPGLLESAYEACLTHLLVKNGHRVERQVPLPIVFDGVKLDCGYRLDLLVDEKVIVELKAVQGLEPIHEAQLMTHLRLSSIRVGLLMNFNVLRMREGIKRFSL